MGRGEDFAPPPCYLLKKFPALTWVKFEISISQNSLNFHKVNKNVKKILFSKWGLIMWSPHLLLVPP